MYEWFIIPSEGPLFDIVDSNDGFSESCFKAEELIIKAEEPVIKAEELIIKAEEPVIKAEESVINVEESVIDVEDSVIDVEDSGFKAGESVIKADESIIKAEELIIDVEGSGFKAEELIIDVEGSGFKADESFLKARGTISGKHQEPEHIQTSLLIQNITGYLEESEQKLDIYSFVKLKRDSDKCSAVRSKNTVKVVKQKKLKGITPKRKEMNRLAAKKCRDKKIKIQLSMEREIIRLKEELRVEREVVTQLHQQLQKRDN
jgi:hypothetical protein